MNTFWNTIKQVNSFGKILPMILVLLTNKSRYKPEIEFSDNSWTHNIFRVYEMIFWRREGIRVESSAIVSRENGKKVVKYKLYTFEAVCAYTETFIRNLFNRKWLEVKIVNLQLATAVPELRIPWISFAIAFDTTQKSDGTGGTPDTFSHTVTGVNSLLLVGTAVASHNSFGIGTMTAVTYAGTALTLARTDTSTGASFTAETKLWIKGVPKQGANNVIATWTEASFSSAGEVSVSYSGAQSSDTADAVNGTTGTTTVGSQSFNVTTVQDRCWVFAFGLINGDASITISANQTARSANITGFGTGFAGIAQGEDTNAAQSIGAISVGFTLGGVFPDSWAMSGASIAPKDGGFHPNNLRPRVFAPGTAL